MSHDYIGTWVVTLPSGESFKVRVSMDTKAIVDRLSPRAFHSTRGIATESNGAVRVEVAGPAKGDEVRLPLGTTLPYAFTATERGCPCPCHNGREPWVPCQCGTPHDPSTTHTERCKPLWHEPWGCRHCR